MENKKVLLSVEDLEVKFRVRGRILTAIRGVSLDIYENESIAIVGESGSGKSVFTKTFAGMLDENGFISRGNIIFDDAELADTCVKNGRMTQLRLNFFKKRLDAYARLLAGAGTYQALLDLDREIEEKKTLPEEAAGEIRTKMEDLRFRMTEAYNEKMTLDSHKDKEKIHTLSAQIASWKSELAGLKREERTLIREHKRSFRNDAALRAEYAERRRALKEKYAGEISGDISDEVRQRNERIAKEIWLSVGRIGAFRRLKLAIGLLRALKKAMRLGVDLSDEAALNAVFDNVIFRVRYIDENEERLHGVCVLNLAKIKYEKDWTQIRGSRIATVFQDPMTSLNPIITIGKQITSVILRHQNCSEAEARNRALSLMKKVGIPNAEKRFDDYPFQYSGGMRQRIVIAIALSCQPKILICDEPTTALDVTIQAQILDLLKDLQKEFGYTIVFITHDLGVVANIADRVAVLYAGQIVEVGKVEEVFYDPRHPYTWALLASLPQLAERNTKLYSIEGTPPSLYNKIVGDPFAPRNPYCLKIDTLKEPPMFAVSETHFAKTWLLDPRAPQVEKPESIRDIHEKLRNAYHV